MPAISLLIKPARIRRIAFFASSSLGTSRRVLVKSLLCRIIALLYRKPAADTADGELPSPLGAGLGRSAAYGTGEHLRHLPHLLQRRPHHSRIFEWWGLRCSRCGKWRK